MIAFGGRLEGHLPHNTKESLRTTLVVPHFKANTLEQVIDRVIDMDRTQNSNTMLMEALRRALPKEEKLKFRQAVPQQ